MIKNKEIIQITELMRRMGENILLEDDSNSETTKTVSKNGNDPYVVKVNCMFSKQYDNILFVNFDFTNYMKYIAKEYGKDKVNMAFSILEAFRQKRRRDVYGPQIRNREYISDDIQYTIKIIKGKPKVGLQIIERLINIMENRIDENLKLSMSFDAIKSYVESMTKVTFFEGFKNKMSLKIRRVIDRLSDKATKISNMLKGKNGEEAQKKAIEEYKNSDSILADDGKNSFHELSLLNKIRIIEQAKEYGVEPPKFCCSMSMITSTVPNGFERKFKDDEEIRPYYIVRPNGQYIKNKEVYKGKSKKDIEALKNNPQMFHKAYLDKDKEDKDVFYWVTYYDIEQTEPIDPDNDVFENTFGLKGNITGELNSLTKAVIKSKHDGEDDYDNEETKEKSPVVINAEKMIEVCNNLGLSSAYEDAGLTLDVDDMQIQAYIAYTAKNLAEKLFDREFGENGVNMDKSSITSGVEYNILNMFGFKTKRTPRRSILADDNVNILTNIVKQQYNNVSSDSNDDNEEFGLIGESLKRLMVEI